MRSAALVAVLLIGLTASALAQGDAATAVGQTLDAYHAAASKADEATYLGLMAPTGVFIGTDATERWEKNAFQAFVHPYFSQGKGWTFSPRDRHIVLSRDGRVAWFDELLDSATYGECRGTGALELVDGAWKIQQYHLTIPMPNDLAKGFVELIRAYAKK